jgi:putative flavoprotein involved in K+ transport
LIQDLKDGDHVDTIVIGGGQAGLTVGYELKQKRREFVIFDASHRLGDAWRKRWDSLLVFNPARDLGLPGLKFPAKSDDFVGKDAVADYLEEYARFHELPVELGVRVRRLSHDGNTYVVETADRTYFADNVVVAMGDMQVPKVPDFAPDLDPDIVQLHSSQYKNPSQLQEGPALIVGMGNSGADIGLETAKTHETYIAGKESAHIPFRIEPWFARNVLVRLVRFVMVYVLNTSTPIGRKVRPKLLTESAPLVRVKPKDLEAASHRVGRITGVVDGKPVVDGNRILDVANVVWCTGFSSGFSWIDLPVFDDDGRPEHERGVVESQAGLYFCGLFFLHSLWSETITGMQRDARYVVDHLDSSRRAATSQLV